jgi:hypothetical protein
MLTRNRVGGVAVAAFAAFSIGQTAQAGGGGTFYGCQEQPGSQCYTGNGGYGSWCSDSKGHNEGGATSTTSTSTDGICQSYHT